MYLFICVLFFSHAVYFSQAISWAPVTLVNKRYSSFAQICLLCFQFTEMVTVQLPQSNTKHLKFTAEYLKLTSPTLPQVPFSVRDTQFPHPESWAHLPFLLLPYRVISALSVLSPKTLFQFILFSISSLQQLIDFFLPKLFTVLFQVLKNSAVQQRYVIFNFLVVTLKKVKKKKPK